jgi:hypothetical protein
LAQRFVHEPVRLNPAAVAKRIGDDDNFEVATAIFRASMAGMQMALILDKYLIR